MLIAEELVLLSLDLDGTTARGASTEEQVSLAAAGALLAELADKGALEISDRLKVTGRAAPSHPLLELALAGAAQADGKKLVGALSRLARHAGRRQVINHLAERGVIGREARGLLRPARHPVIDVGAHAELLERSRAAALPETPANRHDELLLAFAGPAYLLEILAPDRAARDAVKARLERATNAVPAAKAARQAVKNAQAAAAVP